MYPKQLNCILHFYNSSLLRHLFYFKKFFIVTIYFPDKLFSFNINISKLLFENKACNNIDTPSLVNYIKFIVRIFS